MSALPITEQPAAPNALSLTAEAAAHIVEDFIADHLGNLAQAGTPRRIIFPIRALWAVPIVVAYPGYGLAGVIGIAAVDDELASIVAATPIDEMRKAASELYEAHRAEIEAAFRRVSSASD
ncbi:MAG TPA: hypothetical protein VJL59_06580 [Anaerolineales bacterium]|nr:hypothetical protein [Anaerolineales bacterium]